MSGSGGDPTYAYAGAQDAATTGSEYNTRQFQIDQAGATLRTKTPVEVVRAPYDAEGNAIVPGTPGAIGFVDVHPLVNQVDGQGNATPHGTIYRVPYHRYQGGYGAFISDPKEGDVGDYVVDDRDASAVYSTSAQANPGSGMRSSLSSGTYHGQVRAGAPTQFFAFLEHGFNVQDAYGNTIQGTAQGVLINGFLIKLSGDAVTKHGTDVDTHVHTEVTTGSDDTGPPP